MPNIIIMLIMTTGRVTKRKAGRGKYIPWTLVLQLLCNCEKDNLLKSSSASIFSPPNGKFCNISLLLSYRKNVLMTRDHEQHTRSPSD